MKVYALELWGDIECTPGQVRLKIEAYSLDRSVLERLLEKKQKELRDDLGSPEDSCCEGCQGTGFSDGEEEECEECDGMGQNDSCTYENFDLSYPPKWEITEYDLI